MYKFIKTISKWWRRNRILLRLLLFKFGLDKRPVFAVLTVTGHCNFRCKYCFSDYYQKKEDDLPTERILKIIDELAGMGVIYLNVHGGEALLRKDIGEIIDYALSKGLFVNLITNGTLLSKRWDDVKNIDTLCISLDGKEENNDKNRGKGSFKIATEAIEFALKRKATVRIGLTITRHTMNDLEWIAGWAKERNIYIQPFLLFDQDSLPRELWMDREENRGAVRKLIELKKRGMPIFYSFETLNYTLDWPYERPIIRRRDLENISLKKDFRLLPCYYKFLNVLIESNGTVRSCNVTVRGGAHVNILDRPLKKAKDEALSIDDCLHCYHLPIVEFSQLMSLNAGAVLGQFVSQLKEDAAGLFKKIK